MAIIAVCNQKGGCGKTTIAINLAQAFVADGSEVLLLDLDPQVSASEWRSRTQALDPPFEVREMEREMERENCSTRRGPCGGSTRSSSSTAHPSTLSPAPRPSGSRT